MRLALFGNVELGKINFCAISLAALPANKAEYKVSRAVPSTAELRTKYLMVH